MAELDLGKVVMDSYNDLDNKPKINEVELSGNKTLEDLGIQQLIDAVNVSRLSKDVFAPSFETLEDFVVATATDVSVPHFGRMRINTENWGFGTRQIRYLIAYMRAYTVGVLDVLGSGIFWDDTNTMWHVAIHGSIGDLHIQYYKIEPNQIPTNNLLATVAGTPLDAVQGKALNDRCTAISEKLLVSTNVLGDRAVKTDMLDVDFSSYTSDKNKIHRIGASDATLLANSPVTSGQFYGKWECIPYGLSGNTDSSRLMVIITEFYPLQGRVWFNHYNYSKWVGWFSEYNRLTENLNVVSKSKVAFGEMGAYENLVVRGSICCQFNAFNKCDIHISCKVISNTAGEANFLFLSGEKIRALLGLNSFSNNAHASKVIVQNYSGTRNLSEFAGLGGLRAYTSLSTGDIQIGRIYTEEGEIGGWGANSELFKATTIFEIDLFNCSYT